VTVARARLPAQIAGGIIATTLTHLAAHHVNQPTNQPTNKPFSESAILSLNHRPLIGIPAGSLEPSPAADAPYFQFNGNYTAALAAADAIPVVIPPNLPEAPWSACSSGWTGSVSPAGRT